MKRIWQSSGRGDLWSVKALHLEAGPQRTHLIDVATLRKRYSHDWSLAVSAGNASSQKIA